MEANEPEERPLVGTQLPPPIIKHDEVLKLFFQTCQIPNEAEITMLATFLKEEEDKIMAWCK